MIEGKYSYDNIAIPESLDTVLTASCLKSQKKIRKMRIQKCGMVAAAFLAAFLLCNNEAVYSRASGIPVLGTLVELLYVGQGGTVTDGVSGLLSASENTLTVHFPAGENEEAPHYTIAYLTMPRRITVALNGVRAFDREHLQSLAAQCAGIKDLYFLTVLDDSQVKFTMELEDGTGYLAKEYKSPASLTFAFGTDYYEAGRDGDHTWTVRIPTMEGGEPLAMVQEFYAAAAMELGGTAMDSPLLQQVKTQSGLFTMTAGTYATKEEAEEAAAYLNQMQFSEYTWYAEQNGTTERPQ